MPLISHRGAAGLATENTLESIRAAVKFKPVFIEIDVHCTSDGEFVIHHGEVRQALTGERLPESWDSLKTRRPETLTLKDLLKRGFKTPFLFDVKCAADIDRLIEALQEMKIPSTVGFTSPHPKALKKLKISFPYAKTLIAQPYHHGPIRAIEVARDNGFSGISLNKWWLGPLITLLCRHYKQEIMAYTIDNSLAIWAAQTLFPDVYICTNFPDRYRKHFPKQL